jgi:hypothetical protein
VRADRARRRVDEHRPNALQARGRTGRSVHHMKTVPLIVPDCPGTLTVSMAAGRYPVSTLGCPKSHAATTWPTRCAAAGTRAVTSSVRVVCGGRVTPCADRASGPQPAPCCSARPAIQLDHRWRRSDATSPSRCPAM